MSTPDEIVLNEEASRFEWRIDGQLAYEAFERFPGGIAYVHTIVPEALRGRGLAGQLTRFIMDYAREQGLKVRPDCSYVESWITRHPEYHDISLAHGATLGTGS